MIIKSLHVSSMIRARFFSRARVAKVVVRAGG